MADSGRIWISEAGVLSRVQVEYGWSELGGLTFQRAGGWEEYVPLPPIAVLDQLSRSDTEGLLKEALEE